MSSDILIGSESCVGCGHCVRVCPMHIFVQSPDSASVRTAHTETCFGCGHCVAVCPKDAIRHPLFPDGKVHPIDYASYPSPGQLMLLLKARRSNRVFTDQPVPSETLSQILEAAHRAPTASNLQEVAFTVITDPAKLKLVIEFTIGVFDRLAKRLEMPVLGPVLMRMNPIARRYAPLFRRMVELYASGKDVVLRGAKAVILIHAPTTNRFGGADANLAYQNASLMAESLHLAHFYTGFVVSAAGEARGKLEKQLDIRGTIHAGMALGMSDLRYPNMVDRKDIRVSFL